jgi:hypothetical protein
VDSSALRFVLLPRALKTISYLVSRERELLDPSGESWWTGQDSHLHLRRR